MEEIKPIEDKAIEVIAVATQTTKDIDLQKKQDELKILEDKIDKKIEVLKKYNEELMLNGRSKIVTPINPEEEKRNKINKWLESTGLKI